MRRFLPLLGILALASACSVIEDRPVSITPCAPMPEARTSAAAFTVGDKCFVFGGRRNDNSLPSNMFCYDAGRDSWSDLGETPLGGRVNACCAVYDGKVYLGLGNIYLGEGLLRDWWRFNPSDGSWTRLRDYPDSTVTGCLCYAHDSVIECMYGFSSNFSRRIYVYDIASDRWTLKGDGAPRDRMAAAGSVFDGCLYMGTGFDTSDFCDWFRCSPSGSWSRLRDIPGRRSMAVCASSGSGVYLFGGFHNAGSLTGGRVYDEVLHYIPEENKWVCAGRLPRGAMNMIGFTIAGKAYAGLGEAYGGEILNTVYRIDE